MQRNCSSSSTNKMLAIGLNLSAHAESALNRLAECLSRIWLEKEFSNSHRLGLFRIYCRAVTSGQNHGQFRLNFEQHFRELSATQKGHCLIRDDKIEFERVGAKHLQCFDAADLGGNTISQSLEH